ncbi:MAG: L-threonylcarbamoyladenylate synthase [archaeon]
MSAKKPKPKTGKKPGAKPIVITLNVDIIESEKIKRIAAAMRDGKVAVYPTDTVYGLGAVISSEGGVKRIRRIKGNAPSKPLSIAVANLEDIRKYAVISNAQMSFVAEQLPGPVTVILQKKPPVYSSSGILLEGVPDYVSRRNIGIRIPDARAVRRLIELTGPIITTSANKTGQQAPWAFNQVKVKADIMIDGGMCKYKKPSRIIDMTVGEILRQ